jgi:hypothetical protein
MRSEFASTCAVGQDLCSFFKVFRKRDKVSPYGTKAMKDFPVLDLFLKALDARSLLFKHLFCDFIFLSIMVEAKTAMNKERNFGLLFWISILSVTVGAPLENFIYYRLSNRKIPKPWSSF